MADLRRGTIALLDVGESALNVILPEEIFDTTQETLVYNTATLNQALVDLEDGVLFPRVRANANNTVTQQSCYLAYLPTRFASLVIDNKGYTVRQMCVTLMQRCQDEGCLNLMNPLMNWLRLSLHATGPNDSGPPVMHINLVAPFLDQDLMQHRKAYRSVLSGLQVQTPGLEMAIAQFATVVNNQVTEAQTARLIRDLERDQPTTPAVKFDMLFNSLLNMLNVTSEQELPDLWFHFAASKKKQEFGTIRNSLENHARSDHSFGPFAPIPTPKLMSDLSSITFVGDHPEDTETGIQPFMAMDGAEEFRAAAQELARNYTMLAEGDVSITFADLENFKLPKDVKGHPTTYFELERSLIIFGNLLGAVLGNNHPLMSAYRRFWKTAQEEFKSRLYHEIDTRRVIKPVHILRSIQLIVFNWFTSKKLHRTPAVPQFHYILDRISMYMYTNPILPPNLYQLIAPRPTPKFPLPIPSIATQVTDDASTHSNMSSVTGATGTTGLTRGTFGTGHSRYGTAVANPSVDSTLLALLPPTVRIKDLLGTDDAPRNENNKPMCLSYHLRGLCFTNCRRVVDHSRPLTATDKVQLSNWVVDQLAKRRAAGAIPP